MSDHSQDSSNREAQGLFPATRWSLIHRMQNGDEETRRESVEAICRTYWRPAYAWLRARGAGPEDAEDTVQDFFVRLLNGDWLANVQQEKGRLRSLLLVMLKRHAATAFEARSAKKRGGGVTFIHFDAAVAEQGWASLPADGASPDIIFDREWARQLLDRVMAELRVSYAEKGKAGVFDELRNYLSGGSADAGYGESASRLGMNEGAVKVAAYRLRERYRQQLRATVMETVGTPDLVEEELRALFQVFSRQDFPNAQE